MNSGSCVIIALIFLASCQHGQKEWIPLFNGENLEGWTIKMGGQEIGKDTARAYTADSGILKIYDGKKDTKARIGHLFYKKPYSSFRLRFEYRFTGKQFEAGQPWPEQYGGVVFHSQKPESMGLLQDYPVCLEFQLLGGLNSGERPTGNVCTIGTLVDIDGKTEPAHCINALSPTFEGDIWIRAEMEVWKDSLVRHYINGKKVLEYTRPKIGGGFVNESFDWKKGNVENYEQWVRKDGAPLEKGYIGIQAHDSMEYRNIELLELASD